MVQLQEIHAETLNVSQERHKICFDQISEEKGKQTYNLAIKTKTLTQMLETNKEHLDPRVKTFVLPKTSADLLRNLRQQIKIIKLTNKGVWGLGFGVWGLGFG